MSNPFEKADELNEKINLKEDGVTTEDLKEALMAVSDNLKDTPGFKFRMARLQYKQFERTDDKDEQQKFLNDGVEALEGVLDNDCTGDDDVNCLRWFGILLGSLGDFQDTNAKIEASFKIRDAWEKAVEVF
eukprot:TRINITY_DN3885_c0_g2_i2.p2 TRINITY_DN3885_c0_g2~~TRINITY_DN3885_c0_g2_i2.p2  ORF type:complete len:131 (-),score=45.26 TRINITY_DN3885_c0_g2_i2:29-421(-)